MITRLESGNNRGSIPGIQASIDQLRGSQRTSISPLDHADSGGNLLGHYRAAIATGTTVSIGAAGILAYLHWTDPSRFCVLMRIAVGASLASTITTAVAVDLAAVVSRGWTANGSAGNAVTMGGNNQKNRYTMNPSLVSDFRVATTGALTRGASGTADANPFALTPMAASWNIQNPGTATFNNQCNNTIFDLYKWDAHGQHPIVLTNNEALELQEFTAGPATGGIRWYFTLEWAEVSGF